MLTSINWNGQTSVARTTQSLDCDRSGSAVSNWRARIKAGTNASSLFTGNYFNLRNYTPIIGRMTHKENSPGTQLFSEAVYGIPNISINSLWNTDASFTDAQALSRTYKALDQAQSHANGMQFLGELHEVISQLRHPFRAANALIDSYLDSAMKTFKRYKWRDGSAKHRRNVRPKIEQALAESWLETAFGLKPLIMDVKDLAEAAARMSNDSRRDRVRGDARKIVAVNNSTGNVSTGTSYINLSGVYNESMIHSVRYTVFCDWSRSADIGSAARCVELAGFRLDKFVPTVYELIPWSFLVDYFTNLGNVIETGCQSQSMVKFALKTTRFESVKKCVWTPFSSGSLRCVNSFIYPGSAELVRKKVVRAFYA